MGAGSLASGPAKETEARPLNRGLGMGTGLAALSVELGPDPMAGPLVDFNGVWNGPLELCTEQLLSRDRHNNNGARRGKQNHSKGGTLGSNGSMRIDAKN